MPASYKDDMALPRGLMWLLSFCLAVLVLIPKGGIDVVGVPVTWGYLAVGFTALLAPLMCSKYTGRLFSAGRLALVAPFFIYVVIVLTNLGSISWGLAVALLVSCGFMPIVFFVLGPGWMSLVDRQKMARMLRGLLFITCGFGVVAFFLTNYKNINVFVPYLTTTVTEADELLNKHNMRGDLVKLIGTYNNGNIFGVSVLLLLPLAEADRVKRRALFFGITRLALVLTLSRTVWAGLLVYELLRAIWVARAGIRVIVPLGILIGTVGVIFSLVLSGSGYDKEFLTDTTMGGRLGADAAPVSILWLPDFPFIGIREIVYLGIVESYGLVGLALFLPHLIAPLLVYWFCRRAPESAFTRSAAVSVMLYPILCLSDGAYLLIPVSCFYWAVAGFLCAWSYRDARDARVGGGLLRDYRGAIKNHPAKSLRLA